MARRSAHGRPRVPATVARFISVGAIDNFLVSQTIMLKLETKMIFITRVYVSLGQPQLDRLLTTREMS